MMLLRMALDVGVVAVLVATLIFVRRSRRSFADSRQRIRAELAAANAANEELALRIRAQQESIKGIVKELG